MEKLYAKIAFTLIIGLSSIQGFAQELKKYVGRYTFNNIEGTAEYTYKDAPDGTRIFDGYFKFEGRSKYNDDEKYIISGRFKDNLQVGKWTYKGNWYITGREDKTITLTFNNEGILDGEASLYIHDKDNYSINIKNGQIVGKVPFVYYGQRAYWANGHLVGEYLWEDDPEGRYIGYSGRFQKVTGQYNDDGEPIGKWIAIDKDGDVIQAMFSNDGQLEYSYRIDDSTGDKVEAHINIGKVNFTLGLLRRYDDFLMRDSKNIN